MYMLLIRRISPGGWGAILCSRVEGLPRGGVSTARAISWLSWGGAQPTALQGLPGSHSERPDSYPEASEESKWGSGSLSQQAGVQPLASEALVIVQAANRPLPLGAGPSHSTELILVKIRHF